MDTEQPFFNNAYHSIEENQYPNPQEINTTLNSGINDNPSDIYLDKIQNIQNDSPAPPQMENNQPSDDLQYQNSSDFPQYENKINQTQIDYSKYNNINQLPHRGIKQVDDNTFYVTKKCCEKLAPIFWILISLIFVSVIIWAEVNAGTIISCIFGSFFTLIGFYMLCKLYHKVYFQINPNSIRVREVALLGWRTKIYGPGQITNIDFSYNGSNEVGNQSSYNYSIAIYQNIPNLPEKNVVFSSGGDKQLYTTEEICYFNYIMNHHIQTNMNIQNAQ